MICLGFIGLCLQSIIAGIPKVCLFSVPVLVSLRFSAWVYISIYVCEFELSDGLGIVEDWIV
jgi:hypothetical protein